MPAELVCSACRRAAPVDTREWRCRCGGLFDVRLRAAFPREALRKRPPGLWRYREGLPLPTDCEPITLGETVTPLLAWDRIPGARLKLEFLFPTGSFKDRGAAMLLTHMRRLGVRTAVEDSSGNAGAAVAAYAARAGIACRIFVPAATSPGKLTQIRSYGATVVPIAGTREDVTAAARTEAGQSFYASHIASPFFFQGTKTFAFEVWEQLGRRAPDVVVLPVGHGTLYLGAYLGFRDLLEAGEISRLPRLVGVQAEACAPLVSAWRGEPVGPPRETLAEGIRIGAPDRAQAILHACRESGGELVSVSEGEIAAALRSLVRTGLYVEPTAAAAAAGALKLEAAGGLPSRGVTIIPLTGSGLKAGAAIAGLLGS